MGFERGLYICVIKWKSRMLEGGVGRVKGEAGTGTPQKAGASFASFESWKLSFGH